MTEAKKYILIQNDGEIETNSFELIGASTKRDEKGKIGFFGSGLKYSIAYMMRKGIDFKIFSGANELKFSTIKEQLKGKEFERICINGKETSYTVTMGPTWKKDWFVLREIYCNALDEGTCTLIKNTELVAPSEEKTRIYIELTEELRKVSDTWDCYFSDERTPLFVSPVVYTSFLGNEDGLSSARQAVSVYQKTDGVLYRRGIRVYKNHHYLYDYGCEYVSINEDRTAKSAISLCYGIVNIVALFADENYVTTILRTGNEEHPCQEYDALTDLDQGTKWSPEWVRFSKENLLVVRESSGKYVEEIQQSKQECFLIPTIFAKYLKQALPDTRIVGMGKLVGNSSFNEVKKTAKQDFLLKQVLQSLSEMKYTVFYDIDIVDFNDNEVLGHADVETKTIYLSEKVFDMGRREIAMTLMEENEHIRSKKGDETRAFQTHIFSQWLKSMEEANGLFL